MIKIVPSIASCNLMNVEKELKKTVDSENLHIDIEDGNFVPNITFGTKFIRQLIKYSDKPLSIHLMVSNIDQYINELESFNCSHIFIHPENVMYLRRTLNKLKKFNTKIGLAVNPSSNIMDYDYAFDLIDCILYMTSEPDFDGERFIQSMLPKIKAIEGKEIWLDGGITPSIVENLGELRVDYVVMGRAYFAE